ncbi:MAG: TRAP transporter substrate-binding protein [Lachnospiraceae bacterium]|nr:TRAP transporter substrate-binding protein [Lachnospiraceae bacterium]
MKKQKMTAFMLTMALTASLFAGCGKSSANDSAGAAGTPETSGGSKTETEAGADSVVLTYAEVNSNDSLDGKVAAYFKEQVEELSGGTVTIDIQASGVLGAENDVLDGMITESGMVDLCRISIFDLNNYGCEKSSLMGIPFTWESRDHYWSFTKTDFAREILEEPSQKGLGIKGLFYMEEGFRNYFFVNEVKGIEDLQGRKIRVSSDPILTQMTDLLGASATVVSFNELYSSLQSGVVDGGDQPTALYESNAFYEVAPYLLKDQHTLSASEVVMSEASMAKLTEEQMGAIVEAGEKTSAYCREISAQEEADSEQRLTEKGVTIVEVADQTPYREACESLISTYTSGLENEYQQILDCAKQ